MQIFSSLTTPREMRVHYNTQRTLLIQKKETIKEKLEIILKQFEGMTIQQANELVEQIKIQISQTLILSEDEKNIVKTDTGAEVKIGA